ncbi:zeta-sarcoglycan-like [Panulirus ornatus]|uniref:zeta-sarcoglycan-like n=1 Tax=Panulirus ornatus TaxID=150431 RepID=UPI003A83A637
MMLANDNHVGVGTRLVGVVQGYRPQVDWGGDSGSATIVVGGHGMRVATSGWRRRCLYTLLVALLALCIINLSLTLWILKTVYFNVDGMGPLHVLVGGVEMEGGTELLGKVSAAQLLGRRDKALEVSGYHNLTVLTVPFLPSWDAFDNTTTTTAEPPYHNLKSFLHLNVDKVVTGAQKFTVRGEHKGLLYETSPEGTRVGAKKLTVTGSEGAEFQATMQTPHIFSQGVHEFKLESVTRNVKVQAPQDISVEARDGDILATSLKDTSLVAVQGAIRFDNPNIFMPKLSEHRPRQEAPQETTRPTVTPPETQVPPPDTILEASTTPLPGPPSPAQTPPPVQVFQVHICNNV